MPQIFSLHDSIKETLKKIQSMSNPEVDDIEIRLEVLDKLYQLFSKNPEKTTYTNQLIEACHLKDIKIIKEFQKVLDQSFAIVNFISENTHEKDFYINQIVESVSRQLYSLIATQCSPLYFFNSLSHPWCGNGYNFNEVFIENEGIRRIAYYYYQKYNLDIRVRLNSDNLLTSFFQEVDSIIEQFLHTGEQKRVAFITNVGGTPHVEAFILLCNDSGINLFLFDSMSATIWEDAKNILHSDLMQSIEEKINNFLCSNNLHLNNLPNEIYDQLVENVMSVPRSKGYFEIFLGFWLCSKRRNIPLAFMEECMQADFSSCRVITLASLKEILLDKDFNKNIILTARQLPYEEKILTYCSPLKLLQYSQRSIFNQHVLNAFRREKPSEIENFNNIAKQKVFFFSSEGVHESAIFSRSNEKGIKYARNLGYSENNKFLSASFK